MKTHVRQLPLLLLLLNACSSRTTAPADKWVDVTHDKKFWGGYVLENEYTLQTAVFLVGENVKGYSLIAPSSMTTHIQGATPVPETIDEYKLAPEKWPKFSVIDAGTRIRVKNFRLWSTYTHSQLSVFVDIISGEFQAKNVGADGLSRQMTTDVTLWEPIPTVLKAVR